MSYVIAIFDRWQRGPLLTLHQVSKGSVGEAIEAAWWERYGDTKPLQPIMEREEHGGPYISAAAIDHAGVLHPINME